MRKAADRSRSARPGGTRRACLGLVLVLAATAAACGPAASPRRSTEPGPPLRVGLTPDSPPLAYHEPGSSQEYYGLAPDLAAALGHELRRPVTIVPLPAAELLPALRDRTVDLVMGPFAVTPEGARAARFTEGYLQVGQMALVRRGDYDRLLPVDALRAVGLRVGVVRGSAADLYVRTHLRRARRVALDDTIAGVAALRAGTIDAFIGDAPFVWRVAGGTDRPDPDLRGIFHPLTDEQLAWAVRLDDGAFAEQLNEIVRRWRQRGTLDVMIDRWLTVRTTTDWAAPVR